MGWVVGILALLTSVSGSESFRLLSYNVRVDFTGETWINREEVIARTLQQSSPELILIQEASEWMIAQYQAMLPAYYYVVGERSDGHRGDQRWYEFVPIFYHPDRFTVEDHGSFWIGEDPAKPGDTLDNTKHHGRAFNWVTLRDHRTGSRFAVGNVHTHGRRAEVAVKLIVDRLRSAVGNLPLILAGDFNSLPDSLAYQRLAAGGDLGLVDARSVARTVKGQLETSLGRGEAIAWVDPSKPLSGNPDKVARRIDYVFVSPEVQINEFEVKKIAVKPQVFASDHFPIWVEVTMPDQTTE